MVLNGTNYIDGTPPEVANILERVRIRQQRIRLFLGDAETGRCWLEEYDVTGTVGRSGGLHPVPILLNNRRSLGGGAILTHCIVAIQSYHRWLYRHPNFEVPSFNILYEGVYETAPIAALMNGNVVARFATTTKAHRWASFMRGERMGK